MLFDPDNKIVKLCADGMILEGKGKPQEAYQLFLQAWDEAANDIEKFTAAHYVARHQKTIPDKLKWDELALASVLKINEENIKETFPSLYLNIAKCYEDLKDFTIAKTNYELALSFADNLPDNGYGKMIRSGIMSGLERVG